jgi:23S rRNA pseudouridine2605 synthase
VRVDRKGGPGRCGFCPKPIAQADRLLPGSVLGSQQAARGDEKNHSRPMMFISDKLFSQQLGLIGAMLERLQKIIARAGITSRRNAEELITSGLVTVNGRIITELGSKADVSRDHIKISGKLLRPAPRPIYLLLHKPAEVVCTMSDPEGRASLRELLHGISERVFPVGRLEYHSAGLVLLTNDGELANCILQSHTLLQTYHLKLKSLLTFAEIESLTRLTSAQISRLRGRDMPWYEARLSEARRDAVRNKLFQTGHPVEKLKRVGIGNLEIGSLAPGHYRQLSPAELTVLWRLVGGREAGARRERTMQQAKHRRSARPRRPGGRPASDQGPTRRT